MDRIQLAFMLDTQISRTKERLELIDKPENFYDHEELYQVAYHSTVLEAYQVAHKRITEQHDTLESCTSSILTAIVWDGEGMFENPFECALVATKAKALAEVAHQLLRWRYFDDVAADLAE